jgi:hypothetical protein
MAPRRSEVQPATGHPAPLQPAPLQIALVQHAPIQSASTLLTTYEPFNKDALVRYICNLVIADDQVSLILVFFTY